MAACRRKIILHSDWWPGEPLWHGKVIGGKELFVQVRPVPNGYDLSYGGVRARAYVYTAREAELAALMPEKKARRHLQETCSAPCLALLFR